MDKLADLTIREGEGASTYLGAGDPKGGTLVFPKRQFGKDVVKEFLFDPTYRNLNHGSFGTIPRAVQTMMRHYQDQAEARPDQFIRWDYIPLLDASREAVAPLLGVPPETVVFVANATTGVNTVLRSLEWAEDGLDEIIYFDTIYGACGKTIDYVIELSHGIAASRCVKLDYPCDDEEIVSRFRATLAESRAAGKRPRVAIFDVVSSNPGLRFPFEDITVVCHEEGVLSLVDGAQGIGMVDLTHVGAVDPDFFVSNCHKWLYTPRGCAVFYVPLRNQDLIRSTLPTSHGFEPRPSANGVAARPNPLPASNKNKYLKNFQFIGTVDNAPYMCVKDGIRWRQEVLGGEEKIREYVTNLAKEGGKKVAAILGTEILENSKGTLTNCGMVNVALPVGVSKTADETAETLAKELPGITSVVSEADAAAAGAWVQRTLVDDYNTFLPVFIYKGRLWTRMSAQVYLDLNDFEWGAKALQKICERIGKREFIKK